MEFEQASGSFSLKEEILQTTGNPTPYDTSGQETLHPPIPVDRKPYTLRYQWTGDPTPSDTSGQETVHPPIPVDRRPYTLPYQWTGNPTPSDTGRQETLHPPIPVDRKPYTLRYRWTGDPTPSDTGRQETLHPPIPVDRKPYTLRYRWTGDPTPSDTGRQETLHPPIPVDRRPYTLRYRMSATTLCAAVFIAVMATCVICQHPSELTRLDVFVRATLSDDKQTCYLADGTPHARHLQFSIPNIQPCVFLKCTIRGLQVFWRHSGCEYDGACVPRQGVVTVGCRRYTCSLHNYKKPNGTRVVTSFSPQPHEACPDRDVCRDLGYERRVDPCTTLKCKVPGEPLEEIKQDCQAIVPVCDCKTEDGTCYAKGDNYNNDCGTAVCTGIGGGKHAFKPGPSVSLHDCTTPEGVCIRSFRAPHLNVHTCKKYMCIRGSVLPPQTLCYKDGRCQAGVRHEVINGQPCSCRVNIRSGREEWGCGLFK
ncbi:uncharacterized protein [Haliotis cracherodii]|uniref:uncharacterized protein n=1 Tax=Haliotis cracherodii TaxID=6455 RepID=UPI0039E79B40